MNFEILTLLLAMLGAAGLIFMVLVRRMTVQRERLVLIEWANQAGLKLDSPDPSQLGGPLDVLREKGGAVELVLQNATTRLLRIRTDESAGTDARLPSQGNWNILVRHLDEEWKPVGLRPSALAHSFLDLFPLSSFPAAGGTERFLLFAVDSDASAVFPVAAAQALLPQDVGLLMHGHEMILDFSRRLFDDLEFDRIIALAEQLASRLTQVRGQ